MMDTRTLTYHLSLLVGAALVTIGFLLGYWIRYPGIPLMIIFLGPSLFLNSKALLAMTAKPSLRPWLRVVVIIDTLVLDSSVVAMGFLLANGNLGGLGQVLPVYVLAIIVGLTYSRPAYLRILREVFKALRPGEDSPAAQSSP
jgi:hypothetical protein